MSSHNAHMASWLIRALALGLLAITLPLAARGLYGPAGAWVHVRWQPSVDATERQRLETEWQLVDGQEVSSSTWRYDLTAPSEGRLRAIVEHMAVADTHFIDRRLYSLAPEASRTARRHGVITVGGAVAVGLVDRLAIVLAMLAGLYTLVRSSPLPRAVALVLAPVVCLLAFMPVVTRMLTVPDFAVHIENARRLAETGALLPHFGYHALVILVQTLTQADWPAAAGIVTLGGVAACAVVVAWGLRVGVPGISGSALLVAGALVPAALLLVQPILPLDPTRYDAVLFGYFPPNQWHSPTTLFSKPFALLLLGLGPAVVWTAHGARAGRTPMLASAALVVMSALVKPNFVMAFLPGLGVLAVLHWRRTDWYWLGIGFAMPAIAVLAWQYAVAYVQDAREVRVILAPLHVIGHYAPTDVVTLGWRLAASVLFPLAAAACFPSVRADRRVQLGWTTFLIGAAIGYLLAEDVHAGTGNFLWSGQLAAFVLFAASAVAVLRTAANGGVGVSLSRLGRFALCGSVFLWHVMSGIQHAYSTWFA